MSTYRRPHVESVSDDGTFVSSVENQTRGRPAAAPPPPMPPPPTRPSPPPPPVFGNTARESYALPKNERFQPPSLSSRGRRPYRTEDVEVLSSHEGDVVDESPSPRIHSRRETTPAPAAAGTHLPESDSGSDYSRSPERRRDRMDSSRSPTWSDISYGDGTPSRPARPQPPSPPSHSGKPRIASSVDYRGADGRARRASLVISDDGSVKREDTAIDSDSDSDGDLPPGKRSPVEGYAGRSGSPEATDDSDENAGNDRRRTTAAETIPGSPTENRPARRGVTFDKETKPPASAPESDDDSIVDRSPRVASRTTGRSAHRSSSPSRSSGGTRLGGRPGFELLPSITSAVRLPAINVGSRSGVIVIVLILVLFFLPELFPFRFLPLVIPGLMVLASLSTRVSELEYMCLATIFFLDNGLLRAFLPFSTPSRAFVMVGLQALGCSRWDGRLVVERLLRLWIR